MDLHRVVGQEPGVKEWSWNGSCSYAPPSPVGIEPDLAMLVVGEIAEDSGTWLGREWYGSDASCFAWNAQRFKSKDPSSAHSTARAAVSPTKEERGQDTRLHQRK